MSNPLTPRTASQQKKTAMSIISAHGTQFKKPTITDIRSDTSFRRPTISEMLDACDDEIQSSRQSAREQSGFKKPSIADFQKPSILDFQKPSIAEFQKPGSNQFHKPSINTFQKQVR